MKAKNQTETQCPCCGKLFIQAHHSQTFCSPRCRRLNHNQHVRSPMASKTCALCGKSFQTNTDVRKFCSSECAHENTRRRQAGTLDRRNGAIIKCKECGSEFIKYHQNQIYCDEHRVRASRELLPAHQMKCVICGSEFLARRIDAKTCGEECRLKRQASHAIKLHLMEHGALREIFGDSTY